MTLEQMKVHFELDTYGGTFGTELRLIARTRTGQGILKRMRGKVDGFYDGQFALFTPNLRGDRGSNPVNLAFQFLEAE